MSRPKDWGRVRRLYEYICDYIHDRGLPPTYQEMCRHVGISSKSVVHADLQLLVDAGLLKFTPEVSRGVHVPASPPNTTLLPILGTIAAGSPNDSGDGVDSIELPRDMLPVRLDRAYGLRVRGDSMRDALIDDGDLVVIQPQTQARDGEMVAVRLTDRDEYTLKRFYREGESIRLQPANPAYDPIFVHPANVEIQGRVVLVIRRPQSGHELV